MQFTYNTGINRNITMGIPRVDFAFLISFSTKIGLRSCAIVSHVAPNDTRSLWGWSEIDKRVMKFSNIFTGQRIK